MRIGFIDITTNYSAAAPYEGALGGTQAAVCYLGAELAKTGVDVCLVNQRREAAEHFGVKNLAPEILDDDAALKKFSHLVFNGRWTDKIVNTLRRRLSLPFINWMHEACYQQPYILPLRAFSHTVFVSEWQKKLNAPLLPAASKPAVIANGIGPSFHRENADKRGATAVYSGSSKRGLLHLPAILPLIHEQHPEIKFEIYSDGMVGLNEAENAAFRGSLLALPYVAHVGGVDQKTLAEKFARAEYFLSPNPYPETFCIALAEALASGLPCITTARAALPETAQGFAALMPFENTNDPSWLPNAIDPGAFAAFANFEIALWKSLPEDQKALERQRQMTFAQSRYDWAAQAQNWLALLKSAA